MKKSSKSQAYSISSFLCIIWKSWRKNNKEKRRKEWEIIDSRPIQRYLYYLSIILTIQLVISMALLSNFNDFAIYILKNARVF